MKIKTFAAKMQRTRRAVVGALLLSILVTAGAYLHSIHEKTADVLIAPDLPADAEQQVSGYRFTRSEGGRTVFTIHSRKTVAFGEKSGTVLEDVVAEIFGRTGTRRDVIRTRQCEYDTTSGDFFTPGSVEIEMDPPGALEPSASQIRLKIATSRLSYAQESSTARSRDAVSFQCGRMRGTGRGLKYSARENFVQVEREIRLMLEPRPGENLPVTYLTAGRLEIENQTGLIRLYEPVEGTHGNRRLSARRMVAKLDEQGRFRQVIWEDSAKAVEEGDRHTVNLQAQRITGWFDPESHRLQQLLGEGGAVAVLDEAERRSRLEGRELRVLFNAHRSAVREILATGEAKLSSKIAASANSHPRAPSREAGKDLTAAEIQTFTAPRMRITFARGGGHLEQLETSGSGRLELIRTQGSKERKWVVAERFVGLFDEQSRLRRLEGFPRARLEMEPGPQARARGAMSRRSESDRMIATFSPASGALERMEQIGDFRFWEGDRQAKAQRAEYSATSGVMTLDGHPALWDSSTRVTARKIRFDEQTGRKEALGDVRGTHQGGNSGGFLSRLTAKGSGSTNVIADRAMLEDSGRKVQYEGRVRAWRGQDVITSTVLEVFRQARQVKATGKVSTSYLQPSGTSSSSVDFVPVTISADSLDYRDEDRKAIYRGDVVLQADQTRMEADRLEVLFASNKKGETRRIEEANGEGEVRIFQPGLRAEGQQMEYLPEPGKIVLRGGPPVAYDEERGMTTGERLTFSLSDDSMSVYGGENSPAFTRHRMAR